MYVLGIWDGHDSGACIVEGSKILVAVNEERFTRRKLEVSFPCRSIIFCLASLNLKASDIKYIAYSTADFSLTLTRFFPSVKENYYYVRRKKTDKPKFEPINRMLLNNFGRLKSNRFFAASSTNILKKRLLRMGFRSFNLHYVEHHAAHAASAYFSSGFSKAACLTIDGLGDGLSGSVNLCGDNIKRISSIPSKDSLGLFYQEATSLIGMRILEDEGKVMALADYSYKRDSNPMDSFFKINGLSVVSKLGLNQRYGVMQNLLWKNKMEDFCWMVQDILEKNALQLFKNIVEETGMKKVCWSGGIASNIKMNKLAREESGMKDWFVFPHMGDGGLAVGAALYLSNAIFGAKTQKLETVKLGPCFDDVTIKNSLLNHNGLNVSKIKDPAGAASDLILKGNIVFWFQGNMEYGPRALGSRSILADPSDVNVRDKLNKFIKSRSWFQPFCPSVLFSDYKKLFSSADEDRFMTMGYDVVSDHSEAIIAATGIDGSSRPQSVSREDGLFFSLLKNIKKEKGIGAVLNTSFNIHGSPIVCTPHEAVSTLLNSGNKYMVIGNYLVENRNFRDKIR